MVELSNCVTVTRKGRERGIRIYIDEDTFIDHLKANNIPVNTPIEDLRVKRYKTKNNIILRVMVK